MMVLLLSSTIQAYILKLHRKEYPMRNSLLALFLLTSSGCGFFSDGASMKEELNSDCIDQYEDWAEDVADMEDEDDLFELFDDIASFELESSGKGMSAVIDLAKSLNEMDEKEREEYVEEYTDLLEDPVKDCKKAKEKWAGELADNEDACEAYFEWKEERQDSWEDFDEAWSEYKEDNDDAISSPAFFAKIFENIEGPEDKQSKDSCKDD